MPNCWTSARLQRLPSISRAPMNIQDKLADLNAQSLAQAAARAGVHLPLAVSVLLAVLIAYYAARLVWLLVPGAPTMTWEPPPPAAPAIAADQKTDYRALLDAHLFGQASAEPQPVADDSIDAPDTRLSLVLRATVTDRQNQVAHAIIADSSGREKVYFLKSSVPGGATLHLVHTDRVILNRGGVLEALRLPRENDGSNAGRTARRRTAAARSGSSPTVRQVINQSAATIASIIRPQPYMPGGRLKGYRVYPGRNRQQFAALGLRPGDLVTDINGTPLNNPAQGMEIFRGMANSTQVTLTIERNGQSQILTLDTASIAGGPNGSTR